MKAPSEFLKKLRRLDPALDVFFDDKRERWVLIRRYGYKYLGDGRALRDVSKKRVVQVGKLDGRPLFRLATAGSRIGVVENPDGGYAPLTDQVIRDLRAMDSWNRPKGEALRQAEEADAKEERRVQMKWEDGKADVNKTIMGLRNPKIDLGARSCR